MTFGGRRARAYASKLLQQKKFFLSPKGIAPFSLGLWPASGLPWENNQDDRAVTRFPQSPTLGVSGVSQASHDSSRPSHPSHPSH